MDKRNSSQWEKIYRQEGQNYSYYEILKTPHSDMDKVIKIFKKQKVKKVLDLGCGAGRNALYLAQNGFSVFGLDSSPAGLKILERELKKRKLKADLKLGDAYAKLPYPNRFSTPSSASRYCSMQKSLLSSRQSEKLKESSNRAASSSSRSAAGLPTARPGCFWCRPPGASRQCLRANPGQ